MHKVPAQFIFLQNALISSLNGSCGKHLHHFSSALQIIFASHITLLQLKDYSRYKNILLLQLLQLKYKNILQDKSERIKYSQRRSRNSQDDAMHAANNTAHCCILLVGLFLSQNVSVTRAFLLHTSTQFGLLAFSTPLNRYSVTTLFIAVPQIDDHAQARACSTPGGKDFHPSERHIIDFPPPVSVVSQYYCKTVATNLR